MGSHLNKGNKKKKSLDSDEEEEIEDEENELRVFDRFTIILQIFAKRAKSNIAKHQVPSCFGCLRQFLWVDRTGVYPVPQSEVDERWLDLQWHVQHIPRRFDEVITSLGDTCQIQTHNCIKAPRRSNSRWSLRKDEARSVSSLVRVRPSSKSRGESSIRKKANSRRSYKRKCSIEEIWRGDVRKTTSLSLKLLWYYCLPKKNLVRMKYFP